MRRFRSLVTVGLLLALLPAGPAAAAGRATHVSVVVDQSTVHVGSPLVVSGTVTPVRAGAAVTLQRLVGRTWTTLGHQKSSSTGSFSFRIRAPKTVGTWLLRVRRASGGGDRTGTSATLHVRAVKPVFAVKAKAALSGAWGRVVVSGVVSPKAKGVVRVQRQSGRSWVTLATATLSRTGVYATALTLPAAGTYALRVLKPFSTTTAQGVSKTQHVTVPVPDPAVSTSSLPSAVVGRPYSATLSGGSGVGPYTWSATGLPTGITASRDGAVAGITVLPGVFAVTITVADSRGRTGVTVLSLTVQQTHVMSWGYNAVGELGNGTTTDTTSAAVEPGIDGITAVASSPGTVLLLRDDGTVWCQGYATGGACGLGPVTTALTPQQVPGLTGAVAVASGGSASYVLTSDGGVWASGGNAYGQLGNGTTTTSRAFQRVQGLGRAVAVAGGAGTGYALLADGTVWAWGRDVDGELGQGSIVADSPTPLQVVGLTGVTAIAATYYTGMALMADGTVRTWGRGSDGDLGNGTLVNSPTPVAVTGLTGVRSLTANVTVVSAFAVRSDGTLWAWGDNSRGQLGDGTRTSRTTPVQVPGLSTVVQVSAGSTNVFAVLADGTLEAWGEGTSGGLGDGDSAAHFRTAPAAVPGVAGALAAAGGEAMGVALVAG